MKEQENNVAYNFSPTIDDQWEIIRFNVLNGGFAKSASGPEVLPGAFTTEEKTRIQALAQVYNPRYDTPDSPDNKTLNID